MLSSVRPIKKMREIFYRFTSDMRIIDLIVIYFLKTQKHIPNGVNNCVFCYVPNYKFSQLLVDLVIFGDMLSFD